jgi:hypothetical protein
MPKVHREDDVMDEDEVDSFDDYNTGPFCQHYGTPGECDDVCERCKHICGKHDNDSDDHECDVEDCSCPSFIDEGEPVPSVGLKAMKEAIDDSKQWNTVGDVVKSKA